MSLAVPEGVHSMTWTGQEAHMKQRLNSSHQGKNPANGLEEEGLIEGKFREENLGEGKETLSCRCDAIHQQA